MNGIDELLKISNREHDSMSGVAKFWVVLTAIAVGIFILFWLALLLLAVFLK